MSNAVRLSLGVDADTSDAAAAFDKVGQAAKDMANDVEKAGSDAATGARKLDDVASSADNVDTKMAGATGSLGALSSGFELVGADQYATGLQSAAMATDFLAGAGQGLALILESEAVQSALATAKTIALTAAQKVAQLATTAWTGAQKLLNLAMAASPIGLLVVAIGLLVGAVILAYKHSDRFRAIVQKAGEVAVSVFQSVVTWAKKVATFVADKLGPVFEVYATIVKTEIKIVVTTIKALVTVVTTVAKGIKDAFTGAWDKVKKAFSWDPSQTLRKAWSGVKAILTKPFTDAWTAIKAIFGAGGSIAGIGDAMVSAITTAVNKVIDIINKLISAFNKLPGPDIPSIPHVGASRTAAAAAGPTARGLGVTRTTTGGIAVPTGGLVINVYGAVDAYSTAQQIRRILSRGAIISGRATP